MDEHAWYGLSLSERRDIQTIHKRRAPFYYISAVVVFVTGLMLALTVFKDADWLPVGVLGFSISVATLWEVGNYEEDYPDFD